MHRREFLARLALAAPIALATRNVWAQTLARAEADRAPEAFEAPLTATEKKLVTALADGIIPQTDTPGASGAGVPQFMALLFSEWFTRTEQQSFRTGLAALDADCRSKFFRSYAECSAQQQEQMLTAWDAQAFADAPPDAPKPFFRRFKELTIIGYYTSDVGQNQELKVQFGGGQDVAGGPVSQPPPFRF